jgi:hypothetical protein
LIGAPPGYVGYEEGGQLTEQIRRRPYAVVLLDEIEKAHPDVFNMLLQVMEEGRLTDSFGRNIDFRNTILIMTTNAGAEAIKNESAFGFAKPDGDASYDSMKTRVTDEIEKVFRPEFINRVNDIIVFRQTVDDLKQWSIRTARFANGCREAWLIRPTRRRIRSRRLNTPTSGHVRSVGRSRTSSRIRWPGDAQGRVPGQGTAGRLETVDIKRLTFKGEMVGGAEPRLSRCRKLGMRPDARLQAQGFGGMHS